MLKLFIQTSPQFFVSSFEILSDKVMVATLDLLLWSKTDRHCNHVYN